MNILINIKNNYVHFYYTWRHYMAFLKVQRNLLGYSKYKFHDWDKLILYLLIPFVKSKTISNWHRKYSKHHPTFNRNGERIMKPANKVKWTEAIIDWECSRLTKVDKQLNAIETLYKYYPEYKDNVIPLLKDLNLYE